MRKALSRVVALAVTAFFAGCSLPTQLQVRDPEPAQIVDYVALFQPFAATKIYTGGDYVWAGYAYVDHHCKQFFAALEEGRMELSFAQHTSAAGFSAANTILTLAKKSQYSIGVVGAAGTLAAAVFDSARNDFFYGQFSALAQYSGSLWLQTTVAQDDFKNKNAGVQTIYRDIENRPLDRAMVVAKAHNLVQAYANLCTIQQMQVFIQTALNTKPAAPAADQAQKTAGTPTGGRAKEARGAPAGTRRGGLTGYAIY